MCFTLHPTEDDRAYFEARGHIKDEKIRLRILTERLVIRAAIQQLLSKGYALKLLDSDHQELTQMTQSWQVIMKELMACDVELLVVYRFNGTVPVRAGYIFLVYGNDGWDVINDTSQWIDEELRPVNELADRLQNETIVEGT